MPESQVVLIRVKSSALLWKTFMLIKAFWMVKHVTFPDFSGNFQKGPIQYSLVQSQQWKHQNNVSNMFIVNITETRWRYCPSSVVFIVVSFEHILHTSDIAIVGFEKVNIHLFKVNNGDTRIMYQICSKLTIKKLGWRYWPRSGVFIVVNFEHIPRIVLPVPLLALKK